MNKVLLLTLILLFLSNCSSNNDDVGLGEKKTNLKTKIDSSEIFLTKQVKKEAEFNSNIEIIVSNRKFNKKFKTNNNNTGEMVYEGILEKIAKYKFSKFDDFKYIETHPILHKDNLIFSDNKGSIIYYDQNQNIIWKKNFYTKNEKKLKPRLNFAIQKNILIVTDDVAKYYAIDIETGNMLWVKNNVVPFNSNIKIKSDVFYVVDYKNILRSISINDGSELWNLKTEESLTKSNTKLSIAIDEKNIYFNNSIGDITAVNIKSGQLIWQLPTQNDNIIKNAFQLSSSRLVLNEGSIFFSNNVNEFYSIDISTGLINWKNEINSILNPVIIDKLIIAISKTGYLYLLEKKSGNILRINDLYVGYKDKIRKRIEPTGFIIAMGKIYLTNDDGKLIIINGNEGNILEIIKISGGRISKPFINANKLFLISNGSIIKFN